MDDDARLDETLSEEDAPGDGELFAGRYRILRQIGQGGMGAVFQAEDRHVGDVVALKLITSTTPLTTSTVERFRREVRLARRISHRNVARIHDLENHEGTHFLTMEYVEGRDLERILADEGPLAPTRVASIASEICEGLAAAHDAGVIHRDLKPGNVLIEGSGRIVITDFGIARSLADEAGSAPATAVVGTPLYMSPEQLEGHAVDERTDLYALGAMLYEMLVGEPPFCEATPYATALARLQRPAPDPRERTRVPDPVAEVVNRCLERAPKKRPSDARQVIDALAGVAAAGAASTAAASISGASTGRERTPRSFPPEGERRHITVLFADLAEVGTEGHAVDPEEMDEALGHCFEVASRVVARHGGEMQRQAGGGAMATFGWPVARADDAGHAARAAVDLHAELARQEPPLRIRVGLASGRVVVRPGEAPVGEPLLQASRLREAAAPGETRLSSSTRVALGPRARCDEAAGGSEPARLVGLRAPEAELERPFVGRRSELRLLEDILESCREEERGQTVRIRGDAGIGKSRLVERLRSIASSQRFVCHGTRVLDFGVGRGQGAIAKLMSSLIGAGEHADDEARAAAAEEAVRQGRVPQDLKAHLYDVLEVPQPPALRGVYDAMTNEARRRGRQEALVHLVSNAAALGPVLLTVEDLHWADSTVLDHVARTMAVAAERPVVLVVTTRFDDDPFEGSLRSASAGRRVTSIDLAPLGPKAARELASLYVDVDSELAMLCMERAEGNPLFLDQLLCCAELEGGRGVPGSIHGLVLARADALAPEDRAALQAASVGAQRFSLPFVRHLLDDPEYSCEALVERHFVRPEGDDFIFVHALVRDAIHSSLLKDRRRELHRRAARWYAGRDPLLHAEHLDRAADPAAGKAYVEAAESLRDGYHFERVVEAARRGMEIAGAPESRYELACLLGSAQRNLGQVTKSIESYRQALDLAASPAGRCRALLGIAGGLRIGERHAEAFEELDRAEREAVEHDLPSVLAEVHYLRGNLSFMRVDAEGCLTEHRRGLEQARRVGSAEAEARSLGGLGDAFYLQGRMREAHGHFRQCVELCREHGLVRVEVANRYMVGWSGMYLGDLEEAARHGMEVAEMARQVRHQRAELLGRLLVATLRVEQLDLDEAQAQMEPIDGLLAATPTRTFAAEAAATRSRMDALQGRARAARDRLDPILQEGDPLVMTFVGPFLLGVRALAADDVSEARALWDQATELLPKSVSHNQLWFHRDAIDGAITLGAWDDAEQFAKALQQFVGDEGLPWAELQIGRAKALAAWGRGERGAERVTELVKLREQGRAMTMRASIRPVEQALADAPGEPGGGNA